MLHDAMYFIYRYLYQGTLEKLENNSSQYNVDGIPNFTAEGT